MADRWRYLDRRIEGDRNDLEVNIITRDLKSFVIAEATDRTEGLRHRRPLHQQQSHAQHGRRRPHRTGTLLHSIPTPTSSNQQQSTLTSINYQILFKFYSQIQSIPFKIQNDSQKLTLVNNNQT